MRIGSNHTVVLATVFSTIIHFFVFTLLDTFPLIPKKVTLRPRVFMVDLIPLEKKVVVRKKEIPKIEKKEVKKEVKTEVKKEVKKEEKKEVKQEVKTEVRKEVKKDKKKVLTKQKEVKKEKPKVDDEQKRLAAVEEIARRVGERKMEDTPAVTSAQLEAYVGMIRQRVKRFWVIPDTLLERKGLEAVIVIKIDKDGLLMGSRFESSSGNPYFDQSAMRAIAKAAPFPSPLGKAPLEIGLIFQPD